MLNTSKYDHLQQLLKKRILVLDGAMGSMIQCKCHSHDEDNRIPDILVRENPKIIKEIHKEYLEAGADIIETNSFNCNRFSLSDYGFENEAYSLAKKAAELAREAVEEYKQTNGTVERFVAGSVGPTKHMLSLSEGNSEINFDTFVDAYEVQISGLLDGGSDIILLETVFDTLNAKAALYAISKIEEELGYKIPVMISATIANSSGRLLSGQSIEAFYASVTHKGLLSIGINCGFGSADVMSHLERLSEVADMAVSVYPNAGLPDECGEYSEDANTFSKNLEICFEKGLVNIVGGCCGTTPEHIKVLKQLSQRFVPRIIPNKKNVLILSNLDYSEPGYSKELIQVGERTNVAGSAKFARLIREKKFDEALEIAIKQVELGAQIIDICMDDGLEDSVNNMKCFLNLINNNPDTGRIPVMIDSSNWEVIIESLKITQGKSVVNSISLKDGEKEFLRRAKEIKDLGAAMVVMLFDEDGQAETFDHKCRVAERAYRLLTDIGVPAADIIFDPNVLTTGSGLKEDDLTALDFIKATRWIKENFPYCSISGGISNLSFAFRGNNPLRHTMHSVFLYHASKAGLNMAIVNPGMVSLYEDISPELLSRLEDLILWRRKDAVSRLLEYAEQINCEASKENQAIVIQEKELTLKERIENALLRGKDTEIASLMEEALKGNTPMNIIDNLLMPVMKRIGEKFGQGRMFLPQVIKSAQVMKKGISALQPFMDADKETREEETVIIATVKGDVHDIGKNIVGLVASCNGYNVVDLGVRVETALIADEVEKLRPKALLLSGLISPSLVEMTRVCEELERRGLDTPVIIGGAATSELHTAVKIASVYSGDVYYSSDASVNLTILNSLSKDYSEQNKKRQRELKNKYLQSHKQTSDDIQEPPTKAKTSAIKTAEKIVVPKAQEKEVFINFPISNLEELIDWEWLTSSLEMSRLNKALEEDKNKAKEEVLRDAKNLLDQIKREKSLRLEGIVKIFDARTEGTDIILTDEEGNHHKLPMLQAERGRDAGKSIADYVNEDKDYVALFAVTAGIGLEELSNKLIAENDYYTAFLAKLLADRLAEAFSQWIGNHLATDTWGFGKDNENKGCRIAFGYPSSPDHSLKKDVFELLKVTEDTGMRLTENAMIIPSESVCGLILSSGEYINVGKIGKQQLSDYAKKRGITREKLESLLPNNI